MIYKREQTIFSIAENATLWRVTSGVVRLDQLELDSTPHLVVLAIPGDLIGVESLCQAPYSLQAQALTDVVLQAITVQSPAHNQQLMMEALLQHPIRSHDMSRLRTGSVLSRMTHLLRMMGYESSLLGSASMDSNANEAATIRNNLPTLRELAQVVDAKPETVCRTLAQLLPPRPRKIANNGSLGWLPNWQVEAVNTATSI
ncbi:MAG TPA: cyclic nucleotide-binding domain-containing protein [Burkholderiaceae bacterium]|nr:cyclic nucleotide-binding domain-containing protein [Burkholderiaceae bacterium]